jgi:hypothetical protein
MTTSAAAADGSVLRLAKTMGKIREKNNGQDGLISQGQCERRCHAIARSTT